MRLTAWERLKHNVLSTREVRLVDRVAIEQYKMHSLVLMENAGIGCAQWLKDRFRVAPQTLILCGRGNNGGDGLVIARHLQVAGWQCDVLVPGPISSFSADSLANWQVLTAQGNAATWVWSQETSERVPVDRLVSSAELIIDAMLGTGAKGNPQEPFASWIELANRRQAYRVSIDVPTGLNAETGEIGLPTFRADSTLTFVALKPAFKLEKALPTIGELTVLPIGIPNAMIEHLLNQSEVSGAGGS